VVTISGVTNGTFNGSGVTAINATHTITVPNSTAFTVPVNCTAAPNAAGVAGAQIVGGNTLEVNDPSMINVGYTQPAGSTTLTVTANGPETNVLVPGTNINFSSIALGNPCTITTSGAHGLSTGTIVSIINVDGGVFSPAINATYTVTVNTANTFTVPVNCTTVSTNGTGSALRTIKSKVYLDFLSGGTMPADNTYMVQTRNGTTNFTVTTADTPVAARSGNVLIPRIVSSYTPISGNTIVQYNTNTNHALQANTLVWVDAPVINTTPVRDAEYRVSVATDEDHFQTLSQPASLNGGTYPNPAGASNNVVLWPLSPPPTGRAGVVTINQSTFSLGSTEGTLTQSPLNAPTVFNFFFPDYKFPGALADNGLDSPEFQLTTDSNVVNLTNSLTNTFISANAGNANVNGLCSFNNGNGAVVMDLGPYMTVGDTSNVGIPGLVDKLAALLVGAPLLDNTKTAIVNFVANTTNFPLSGTPTPAQKRDRVRAIIHLIVTSAEYAVQK
jgi:hypothetical protein